MSLFKRIIVVILGTMLLGLGVAICKIASLGQDSMSAFCFSLMYLTKETLPYMVWYSIVNSFLFVFMIIYLRDKINIGTFISLFLTGFFSDMFLEIYNLFDINEIYIVIRLLIGIIGMVIVGFGIAIYGSADLGLGPYDAIPIILSNKINKFKYKYARITIELFFVLMAFIIGNIVLKRIDIIGINTLITFICLGPTIAVASKIINKYILKKGSNTFN